jgi:membrane protease YdiL (CAAX protease family)
MAGAPVVSEEPERSDGTERNGSGSAEKPEPAVPEQDGPEPQLPELREPETAPDAAGRGLPDDAHAGPGLRPDERAQSGTRSPRNDTRLAVQIGVIGGVIAWFLLGGLPFSARVWTAVLLAPLPALISAQHRLVPDPEALPRIPVYASSIISLWVMALITTLVARAAGYTRAELGIEATGWLSGVGWAAAAVAAGMLVVFGAYKLDIGRTAILDAVIPRTAPEKRVFAGLSITAGICEELVFRGFLILTLTAASGSTTLAVVVSTIVFGWMHTYQGVQGAIGAAILGGILAVPVIVTGSILPSIVAHAAIDVLAGIVFAPTLYGRMA